MEKVGVPYATTPILWTHSYVVSHSANSKVYLTGAPLNRKIANAYRWLPHRYYAHHVPVFWLNFQIKSQRYSMPHVKYKCDKIMHANEYQVGNVNVNWTCDFYPKILRFCWLL